MATPQQSGEQTAEPAQAERQRFTKEELLGVCARYPIGAITAVNDFPHGSPKSPKAVVRTDRGRYLLKRRDAAGSDPFRVAVTHQVQLYLAERGFPTPAIIGTTDTNNSILQIGEHVYELFTFVEAGTFDNRVATAANGGAVLAQMHNLMAAFNADWTPATRAPHGGLDVDSVLRAIGSRIEDPGPVTDALRRDWDRASGMLDRLGIEDRAKAFAHGDWHPGNALFLESRVAAVLDFDSVRLAAPVVDLAMGAIHYALVRGRGSPGGWTERPDLDRLAAFWRGYREVIDHDAAADADPGGALDRAAAPWLMIETLIGQSAPPVASTGGFGRHDGRELLLYVARMTAWLRDHAASVSDWLAPAN